MITREITFHFVHTEESSLLVQSFEILSFKLSIKSLHLHVATSLKLINIRPLI